MCFFFSNNRTFSGSNNASSYYANSLAEYTIEKYMSNNTPNLIRSLVKNKDRIIPSS